MTKDSSVRIDTDEHGMDIWKSRASHGVLGSLGGVPDIHIWHTRPVQGVCV